MLGKVTGKKVDFDYFVCPVRLAIILLKDEVLAR